MANMVQVDFGTWIKKGYRKSGIELFTTNYDYLLEIGLECNDVPYYDGFIGSYKPFFDADSVEDLSFLSSITKVWKIHGSLGLFQEGNKIVRGANSKDDLLIYPSYLKYSNSKKQPYASLMDRLNNFLKQDDSVLFVCGYSFGDEHINERILSALKTQTTAHVYVLLYDIKHDYNCKRINSFAENEEVAKLALSCSKISVLSSRKAIFGSQIGDWKLKREPDKDDIINVDTYFDQDAPYNDTEIGAEFEGNESWTGYGELTIIDFPAFVKFLTNMIPKDSY